MGGYAYQSPGAPGAFSSLAAPFARIGRALGTQPPAGTTNQVGHDARAVPVPESVAAARRAMLEKQGRGGK